MASDLLVIAAQKGNRSAFEALYRFHRMPLARFAYRECGDEQIALDAVQDAWVTLSKTLRRLNDPRSFRSWAYKTVRWRVIDIVRRRQREKVALDAVVEQSAAADTEQRAGATSSQLAAQIAKLTPDEQQIITLFYLEDMKAMEIAGILEIPIGTVKSRLSRARSQLRQQMTGDK